MAVEISDPKPATFVASGVRGANPLAAAETLLSNLGKGRAAAAKAANEGAAFDARREIEASRNQYEILGRAEPQINQAETLAQAGPEENPELFSMGFGQRLGEQARAARAALESLRDQVGDSRRLQTTVNKKLKELRERGVSAEALNKYFSDFVGPQKSVTQDFANEGLMAQAADELSKTGQATTPDNVANYANTIQRINANIQQKALGAVTYDEQIRDMSTELDRYYLNTAHGQGVLLGKIPGESEFITPDMLDKHINLTVGPDGKRAGFLDKEGVDKLNVLKDNARLMLAPANLERLVLGAQGNSIWTKEQKEEYKRQLTEGITDYINRYEDQTYLSQAEDFREANFKFNLTAYGSPLVSQLTKTDGGIKNYIEIMNMVNTDPAFAASLGEIMGLSKKHMASKADMQREWTLFVSNVISNNIPEHFKGTPPHLAWLYMRDRDIVKRGGVPERPVDTDKNLAQEFKLDKRDNVIRYLKALNGTLTQDQLKITVSAVTNRLDTAIATAQQSITDADIGATVTDVIGFDDIKNKFVSLKPSLAPSVSEDNLGAGTALESGEASIDNIDETINDLNYLHEVLGYLGDSAAPLQKRMVKRVLEAAPRPERKEVPAPAPKKPEVGTPTNPLVPESDAQGVSEGSGAMSGIIQTLEEGLGRPLKPAERTRLENGLNAKGNAGKSDFDIDAFGKSLDPNYGRVGPQSSAGQVFNVVRNEQGQLVVENASV